MSQNPLDRVRRALDPHVRSTPTSQSLTGENPTETPGEPVIGEPEVSSSNVNATSGVQTIPDSAISAGILTSISSPSTNFSGFSPIFSVPSQTPNILLATRGSEGLVGTGTAVGSLKIPTPHSRTFYLDILGVF